ncbi:2-lysophosphatidate phosphatase plppr4 [Ataeniobius toweri]|uniref:2-lysophosphatidate phosphatase plppr4 n=1 Tax=Ataeniobius toweri TaxID=208326 RepID=A0ABU7BRL6_9TELE|nr:2-lysophosphatidate phosphatase plppr4 [Ataeniobius toweri]
MSVREKGVLTKDSVSLLPCFYFVELPILVSSVVSLYFLEWTDVFKPVKSGYNCHDRSLSLPYVDPNHEVIPLLMLLSLAFAGPAITPISQYDINHKFNNPIREQMGLAIVEAFLLSGRSWRDGGRLQLICC